MFLVAYLSGSIPFGKLAGRFYGIDIQKHGSSNIGFANVRRVLGWRAGLAVLAGDTLKGFMPVLIAVNLLTAGQVMVTAVLVLAGSIFPIWLKFKGGKGVATLIGISLAATPMTGVIAALIYALVVSARRNSAPGSLAAIASLPVSCAFMYPSYGWFYAACLLVIIWTHRSNIKLMSGLAHGTDKKS